MSGILTSILIVFAGPAATLYMVIAGKGFKIRSDMCLYVGTGAAIALVVSLLVHSFSRKNAKRTFLASVIAAELVYLAAAIIDALHAPKSLMWLPVTLLFLPLYTLPTAISVSYGIGRLFNISAKSTE